MSSDINPHENVGHPHRSGNVTNVAKVEVGRVFYLQVEAEDDREHDKQEVEGVHGGGAKI
jgi:phosphoribosylformylglycinamidine (FGAM) synthase PurS component